MWKTSREKDRHTNFESVYNTLQIYFFGRGSFYSSQSARFEENLQKIFAFFFESEETVPLSFNFKLSPTLTISNSKVFRNFKARQSSLGLVLFSSIFSSA